MMDDDSTPMSRTELAMLWDLLGRWLASHQRGTVTSTDRAAAMRLQDVADAELTDRFGG